MVQSWKCVKSTGTSLYTELTIASIIISDTQAPLQLCIVAPNHITIANDDYNYLWSDNTECSVANNYTCYRSFSVQACSCAFYTSSAISSNLSLHILNSVYLFNFWGKKYLLWPSLTPFYCPRTNFVLYITVYSFILNTVCCTHGMMVSDASGSWGCGEWTGNSMVSAGVGPHNNTKANQYQRNHTDHNSCHHMGDQ